MLVPGGRFTGVEDTGQVEGLETPDPVREGVDPLRLVNARILFTVQLLSINQSIKFTEGRVRITPRTLYQEP